MKAKIKFWNGYWWSRRMGVTGRGDTPAEAYEDMWGLYMGMVRPKDRYQWVGSPRG